MRIHRQKYRFQLSTIFQQQKVGLNRLNWTYQKNKRQNPYKSEQTIDETYPLILGWYQHTADFIWSATLSFFLITKDIWENDPTNLQWIARMIPKYEVSPFHQPICGPASTTTEIPPIFMSLCSFDMLNLEPFFDLTGFLTLSELRCCCSCGCMWIMEWTHCNMQ